MNEVFRAAAELQAVCASAGWRYCFIGGLVLQRWAEPRTTVDADLTLITGFGDESRYVDLLLRHFAARIPDAAEFALQSRVLLLRSRSGVGLDVALGALPFEEIMVARATDYEFPGSIVLRTCSAEDLLILKAFAGRTQDWADVERLLVRQADKLDWEYVRLHLTPLAAIKGEAGLIERLDALRVQLGG